MKLRDVAYMVYRCDIETMYDRRLAAGQTMRKPHFRDNPDAAGKLRKLVASQETSEDKQSLMLRILMMEHFSQRCQEGEIYCIQGPLPEPRYLKDSLIPGGDVRKDEPAAAVPQPVSEASPSTLFGSPDKVEPLVPDGDLAQAQQPAAQSDDDQPRQFVQARRSASVACRDRIHCFKFFLVAAAGSVGSGFVRGHVLHSAGGQNQDLIPGSRASRRSVSEAVGPL